MVVDRAVLLDPAVWVPPHVALARAEAARHERTYASPEDAVFVDLDNDGAVDVISCCEGKTKSVFVHWAPRDKDKYLDAAAWKLSRAR